MRSASYGMKIKNIEKVAERLKEAAKNKEKIVLHGDSDLDGIASVIILKETLEEIKADVSFVYFPDRGGEEGYGLSFEAIDYLKKELENNFLMVILDSGMTSFEQIKKAENSGIEVIVVDHHQPFKDLPDASLIVNPKQTGDNYFFKNLANAGIAFKLVEEILGNEMSLEKKDGFLELTALATISDMMEQEKDNKFFIEEGLKSLENTKRKGLKTLKESIKETSSIKETAQKIIALLNVGKIINHKAEGYNLLVSQNDEEIKKIIKSLIVRINEKHLRVEQIMKEIETKGNFSENVIFEYNSQWEASLLGSVASKLYQKTGKTVFLLSVGKDKSKGAVRAPSDVNAVDVMSKNSDILETFGGHPPAAGFVVKNENIEEFKKRLIEYFDSIKI